MRVVVTGAAGFIGRALVNRLATRGVDVLALVRDPARATYLVQPRVTLKQSDLSDVTALQRHFGGVDGVIHAAGSYRVGIAAAERPKMLDANLGTTERVLDAATQAGTRRIVYLSTVTVFGDTGGRVVDETYRRNPATKAGRFLSWYDETKYRAHQDAEQRIAQGAPIVIALPAQVYGPNDHSAASEQLELAFRGKLRYVAFPSTGLAWVHVDDLVDGIVAALIRGRVGQSYVLAGEPLRMRESVAIAARAGGYKPVRLTLPTAALRLLAALQRRGLRVGNAPDDLGETIRAGEDATYWASHAKATRELGFDPRPLARGAADTWGALSPSRTRGRPKTD